MRIRLKLTTEEILEENKMTEIQNDHHLRQTELPSRVRIKMNIITYVIIFILTIVYSIIIYRNVFSIEESKEDDRISDDQYESKPVFGKTTVILMTAFSTFLVMLLLSVLCIQLKECIGGCILYCGCFGLHQRESSSNFAERV